MGIRIHKRMNIRPAEVERVLEYLGDGEYLVQYCHFKDRQFARAYVEVTNGVVDKEWTGDLPLEGEPMNLVSAYNLTGSARVGDELGQTIRAERIDVMECAAVLTTLEAA